MKRFKYLNNDTLSSYMSQIEGRLIKNKIETTKIYKIKKETNLSDYF